MFGYMFRQMAHNYPNKICRQYQNQSCAKDSCTQVTTCILCV